MADQSAAVTREDALAFADEAFRNRDIVFSHRDVVDMVGALDTFLSRRCLASVSSASAEGREGLSAQALNWRLLGLGATLRAEEWDEDHAAAGDVEEAARRLAASPGPVPATNQAGEVEEAPSYDFTMSGDLETVEAEPRAIEKDPFDWPGATGLFMGLFERRDQSEFKMHSGLWDVDGMSQNWPEVPNLRNRATLATQPATSQEGEGTLANPSTFGKPTFGFDDGEPVPATNQAGEVGHTAAFHAIYGPNADPFQNPSGYAFSSDVADAVLDALATQPATSQEVGA